MGRNGGLDELAIWHETEDVFPAFLLRNQRLAGPILGLVEIWTTTLTRRRSKCAK